MPRAFTDYGILMLSSVLHSQKAVEVNIQIIVRHEALVSTQPEMVDSGECSHPVKLGVVSRLNSYLGMESSPDKSNTDSALSDEDGCASKGNGIRVT